MKSFALQMGRLALGISVGVAGCGGATDDLPRQAVSGRVTLDGKPLPMGTIAFDPDGPGNAHPVAAGGDINNGAYTIARAGGPTPGTYRVAILAADPTPAPPTTEPPGAPPKATKKQEVIPEKYNGLTTLKAEVKAGGANTFNFELSSK